MSTNFIYIDLSYLDLMADGDVDMKQMMLDMLLEELPMEIDKMGELLAAKDWNELREVAHKMKSTLSFVGNNDMTEANKTIEDIGKKGGETDLTATDEEKLSELVAILQSTYPNVVSELKVIAESI